MRKLTRVLVLVLALLLAIAPMCSAAETALTNTVWQVGVAIGGTKGVALVRFYEDKVLERLSGVRGSYSFDATTGKLVANTTEGKAIKMIVEGKAVLNKKETLLALSEVKAKSETGPLKLVPFTFKLTKLVPKASKVSAKIVPSGTPSTITIKANSAAEFFTARDKGGNTIASGEVVGGVAIFQHTFTAKKNPITVTVGLLDQNGHAIANSVSKPIKGTIRTK